MGLIRFFRRCRDECRGHWFLISTFAFMTWLTPFLPLTVLSSLGVVMLDTERPRLFKRTLTLKLAQLGLLALSAVFMMACMERDSHDIFFSLLKMLVAVGGTFVAFLYFLVSPVSNEAVVAAETDREDARKRGPDYGMVDPYMAGSAEPSTAAFRQEVYFRDWPNES